ncbi:unnamed protein product [Calicophoron daubneyi]|uniref:Mediator of RNA polymerase II transcription subunit 17 n=1 Tax=Calicophoron daubneyi TaxID=300641 RepID=A0AAV2TLU6_CALDB
MPGQYPQQPIPIEALSEYDVQEILLDGREILEKPPTPAEHFQKILNRIDFNKSYDEKNASKSEVADTDSRVAERNSAKMWSTVREASRMALTEINAFVDILAVIQEAKYLSVFPIARDPPEPNLALFIAGKKRALSVAAEILLKGTERLRRRHSELADARSRFSSQAPTDRKKSSLSNSFHKTLMQLRREWRLKLQQHSILGDVSLRSVGSRFRESGNFEVRESDLIAKQKLGGEEDESFGGVEVVFSRSVEALLNTTVGFGSLTVSINEPGIESGPTSLWDSVFDANQKSADEANPLHDMHTRTLSQRERLVKAQRILACREILFNLACEASGSRAQANHYNDPVCFATQDKIIATLFPGVQLSVGMTVRPPPLDEVEVEGEAPKRSVPKGLGKVRIPSNVESMRKPVDSCKYDSLGLQLHRILAAQHRAAWSNLASLPQVASGPVQVPAKNRAAGAQALPLTHFNPSVRGECVARTTSTTFSIAVASVAGFAGPAAAAWSTHNMANRGFMDKSDAALLSNQRLPSVSISQDRLSLFTEWGSLQSASSAATGVSVGPMSATNPFDDSVQGTASVAAIEHILNRRGADDGAIESVIGSSASLLDRAIAIARHYYLREKVSELLTQFARDAAVRVIVHWDSINSAVLTSARICFYASNYDAHRSWLGLSISHSGVSLFYPNPPRTCHLGIDLTRLRILLANQVLQTQMQFLDILSTKILGWTRLGNNPCSGLANPEETGDGPIIVKMFASPSGRSFICLRASVSNGIRLSAFSYLPPNSESGLSKSPVLDTDSLSTVAPFREVDLSAVRSGSNAVAKVEAIMTVLS